jgi:hypothetical protein
MEQVSFKIAFNSKGAAPREAALERELGPTYPLYEEILRLAGGLPHEWKFYGPKHGWQFKVQQKGKALFYLLPLVNSFRLGFAVRERERDVLLKSKLPAKMKEELRAAKKYGEGYPVRLDVAKAADLGPVRTVIKILLSLRS